MRFIGRYSAVAAVLLTVTAAATTRTFVNGDEVDWSQPYFSFPANASRVEITRLDECWNASGMLITGQNDRQQRIWGPFRADYFLVHNCSLVVVHLDMLPDEPDSFVMQVGPDQHLRFAFTQCCADSAAAAAVSVWIWFLFLVVLAMVIVIFFGCLNETKMPPYTPVPACEPSPSPPRQC